jgi:hypothetical protein
MTSLILLTVRVRVKGWSEHNEYLNIWGQSQLTKQKQKTFY